MDAATAFERIYAPAIGLPSDDYIYREDPYSIIEFDDFFASPNIGPNDIKEFFDRFLDDFVESLAHVFPTRTGPGLRP